jgi:hypothetical protein
MDSLRGAAAAGGCVGLHPQGLLGLLLGLATPQGQRGAIEGSRLLTQTQYGLQRPPRRRLTLWALGYLTKVATTCSRQAF